MTTTLSPVTESEMNSFFDGIKQFQHRLATAFFAMAEQASTITNLQASLDRLQASVDALTNSVNTLTAERNQALIERDQAKANEAIAMEMAQAYERDRDHANNALRQANEVIGTLQEDKCDLEAANCELQNMNQRQTETVEHAIADNQSLQSTIASLREQNELLERNLAEQGRLRTQDNKEVQRLTNMLVGAKAVLDGVPHRQDQAA